MAADASAYAVLGLDPGADAAEVEQAYKRLIKQHHPDRSGGDTARAAEITSAYRELRALRGLPDPLERNDDEFGPRKAGRAWLLLALLLAVSAMVLVLSQGPLEPAFRDYAWLVQPRPAPMVSTRPAARADPMDQALNDAEIDAAVREATLLTRTKDEMSRAGVSRDCHRALRADPSLAWLDRCAAFDAAVIQLQDRDPLRAQGPFSEIAVTGRIRASAVALTDDPVAIDARVERIRRTVEQRLAQPEAGAR
jgi:hypothetical protein